MSKKCQISCKIANNGYKVSHSHVRTKTKQHINLQRKRIWSVVQSKWIRLKIAAKCIKNQHKVKF